MTTTELTGAEDVAWDLSDLYDGGDDPRIEQDVEHTETAATAFRERYYGRVAELSAGELRDAIEERERIESTFTRAIYYAHLWFSTDMNDSQRGALVARLTEKGAAIDTQLLFFGLELAALEDDQADALLASDELERWRHWLRTVRKFRPHILTEPEEKILTEKSVSGFSAWDRLYDELLGAIKVDLDGKEIGFEEAMSKLYSADREERRRASEAVTVALAPGSAHPDVRLQHDRRRQLDRRPSARVRDVDLRAQPLERHDRRGRAGAHRRGREPLRRRPALLHAQGAAPRARPAVVLRPHGTARRRPDPRRLGGRVRARAQRVRGLLDRDRRHRRALLPRELDRRSSARRQAAGSLLRDQRARCAPLRLHELHGRSTVRADARARARSRSPRVPRRAARALQRVHAADDRRDGIGLRRGAHVQAPARPRGGSATPAQPARRDGSRTRSRPSTARSR